MDNFQSNKETLEEEVVLKNAEQLQKSVEELQRSAEALNTCDIIEEKDKDNIERTEILKMSEKRAKKQKVQTKRRFLGHHRYYLHSGVKIKHVVLFILVIAFAILCIGKLMPPKPNMAVALGITNKSNFGENIEVSVIDATYNNNSLLLTVSIQNNEKDKIEYNPTSFIVTFEDKAYSATIIEDSDTDIYANGLESGRTANFTLKYVLPKNDKLLTLTSSFKSETESCVIKTSVDMGNI